MFTPEISAYLKYYVYRLIDPRNGQTFYVGKGKDNRVFMHAKGKSEAGEDALSNKLQRIREIHEAGFEVTHVIHRHGMDSKTAFEVEAALIEAYPEVINIAGGHNSDDRGVMHSDQIIERYKAEEIKFKHKVVMININQGALEHVSILEAVRYAWRINKTKVEKADFVLAMRFGLVIGVFVAEKWLRATPKNFPNRPENEGRWGFVGHEAPAEIKKLYLRKRLPDSMRRRGASNPIRYNY